MKKKIASILTVIAIATAALWNINENQEQTKLSEWSDIISSNVEALASGESGGTWNVYYRPEGDGYNCWPGGSEKC